MRGMVFLALGLAALSGCRAEPRYLGEWKGPDGARISITADGTFIARAGGNMIRGQWKQAGQDTLESWSGSGTEVRRSRVIVSRDGKTLQTTELSPGDGATIVYTRE